MVDKTTDNLKINICGYEEYDDQESSIKDTELYVVKDKQSDEDNAISSRTYADVGRYAVQTQTTEPTNELTQIWIDPDEDPVYVSPASTDMDNLTDTGKDAVIALMSPDYNSARTVSTAQGGTYTITKSGWLFATLGNSSALTLLRNGSEYAPLMKMATNADTETSGCVFVEKGCYVSVTRRSGTVYLLYAPNKGAVA